MYHSSGEGYLSVGIGIGIFVFVLPIFFLFSDNIFLGLRTTFQPMSEILMIARFGRNEFQ